MNRHTLALLAASAFASAAHAADINPQLLTQPQFRALSEDMGAVVSYKPLIPSEPSGITGFDIGVAVTGTKLKNHAVWEQAAGGSDVPSTLPVPTVRVHKGLPLNIDIGAFYSKVPTTNIQIGGGELRWAFVPGGTLTPALAARVSYTRLSGVDNLKFDTTGFDVSISKGFAFFTPYAGAGIVKVKSKPGAATLLAEESFDQSKVFAGLNMNFGLANIALEADRTGKATSAGVKFGFRF